MFGRVAVAGHSMEPTLRDGDWLLYTTRGSIPVGSIVVARDPRQPERWIVKRVSALGHDVMVLDGDAPLHETGAVPRASIVGRVVFRYWPPRRIGPISEKRRNR